MTAPRDRPIVDAAEGALQTVSNAAKKTTDRATAASRSAHAAQSVPHDAGIGLRWLVSLRWGAVVAQGVALAAARWLFGADLQIVPLLALLTFAAITNAGLALWSRRASPSPRMLTVTLLTDVVLLTLILYASGGPSNPFSILYLVQVALAAILVESVATWIVVVAACVGYGLLFIAPALLPSLATVQEHHDHTMHGHGTSGLELTLHLQGMWVAFAVAAVLVGYFVGRLAKALRARTGELLAARELAARHERVAALTTLAAGAAHELGTPLGTIAVVARELERTAETLDCAEPLREDVRLIGAEVERCRSILQLLSEKAGDTPGEAPEPVALDAFLAMVRESSAAPERVHVRCDSPVPTVVAPPRGLRQVVGNLVQNALDASPSSSAISVDASSRERGVEIRVHDRGAGMDEQVLARAGEPFFTTKPSGRGLGLGLFLARAFAERLGGTLTIHSLPHLGTTVAIELPTAVAR